MTKTTVTWRQYLVRLLFFPVPGLDHSIPVIGGKSVFEISVASLALLLCLALSIPDAGTAGNVANYAGAFIVTLGLRNNILYGFFGLTFERALFWHKVFATLMICVIIIHAVGENSGGDVEDDKAVTGYTIAGLIGTMSVLYLVSFLNFNLFNFVHIFCFMPLIFLAFLHGATIFGGFGLLWIADILVRYVFTHKKLRAKLTMVGPNITKIFFPRTFDYTPGQYCFLMIRNINMYEYHPFSIISSPQDSELAFLVKNSGDWTNQVYNLLNKEGDEETKEEDTLIGIEGPYGAVGLDIFHSPCHEVVMFIGGGIGITPLLSLWSHVLHQAKPYAKKVVIVWCARNIEEAEAIYTTCVHPRIQASLEQTTAASVIVEDGAKAMSTFSSTPTASDSVLSFEYHFHITSCAAMDGSAWDKAKEGLSVPTLWSPTWSSKHGEIIPGYDCILSREWICKCSRVCFWYKIVDCRSSSAL